MLVLLSGDIQLNPGPVKQPCSVCKNPVARTHRALRCDSCMDKCHIGKNCGNVDPKQYEVIKLSVPRLPWVCPPCLALYDQAQQQQHQPSHQHETGIGQVHGECCYQLLKSKLCQRKEILSVAHINVNGILTRNKLDEVKLMLEITGLDLLGVTETKLNQNNSDRELKIDGYKMERNDRSTGGEGGVMFYYKETLDVAPYLVKTL